MKGFFKAVSAVLVLSLLFTSALTGCVSSTSRTSDNSTASSSQATTSAFVEEATSATGPDISKHVNLNWVMIGSKPKDFDSVAAEMNKKTNIDLNAEISFSWIDWGELNTKYQLTLMSGQPNDLIYSATWIGYTSYTQKKAYMELTQDMLSKYAPTALKVLPKQAWDDVSVGGKIYGMPRNFLEYNTNGVVVRGDIMKAAGLTAVNNIDDLMIYMAASRKVLPNVIPLNDSASNGSNLNSYTYGKGLVFQDLGGIASYYQDTDANYVRLDWGDNGLEPDPVIVEIWGKIHQMYLDGYIPKNVLNNKTLAKDLFPLGQSTVYITQDNVFRDAYANLNKAHPDWDCQFFSFSPNGPIPLQPYSNGLMCIPASSKNPERTLMLMDKFFSSSDYYMTLTYGVESKHWQYTADESHIEVPSGADPTFYPPWQHPWGFGDWVSFNKPSVNDWPGYVNELKNLAKAAKKTPLYGIAIDTSNIKNEIAAVQAAYLKYTAGLNWGVLDPVTTVPKMIEDEKKVGKEKVYAEIKKQIDAFLASKK